MWELFNPENKFIQIINKMVYSVAISILWLLMCFTIIGIGPATTALYHTTVKSFRKDAQGCFRAFFVSVRDSWKVTIPTGILVLVMLGSLIVIDIPNIYAVVSKTGTGDLLLGITSLIKTVATVSITIYAFPIFSRFHVGFVKGIMLSVVIAFRHFLTSFIILLEIIVAVLLTWYQPILILFAPAALMLMVSFPMEKVLIRYLSEEDRMQDPTKDQWYLEQTDKE